MRTLKLMALMSMALLVVALPRAKAAEVGIAIGVGPAHFGVAVGAPPVCAYGYYPDYPYTCAPMGYYGPEWFSGGVFIGAGPWFHPYSGFRGHYPVHDGFYAGRGFYHAPAPVIRDRGNFGRVPPAAVHPAFRNDFHGNAGSHFNGGGAHGFASRGESHGSFHGGGRR